METGGKKIYKTTFDRHIDATARKRDKKNADMKGNLIHM